MGSEDRQGLLEKMEGRGRAAGCGRNLCPGLAAVQPRMAYPERGIWSFFILLTDRLGPSLLLPVLGSNTAHRSRGLAGEGEKEACPGPGFLFSVLCYLTRNRLL